MILRGYNELEKLSPIDTNTTIGITSGCFDLLHPLHVDYLTKCKRFCEYLLVFIDSDYLVSINKHKIPEINEYDRAYMVDSLKAVDSVFVFNDYNDMNSYIKSLVKNKFKVKVFKRDNQIYGNPIFKYKNVENIVIPDIKRFESTTDIVNHQKRNRL